MSMKLGKESFFLIMIDYDKKMDESIKRNKKFIDEFKEWLESKKLGIRPINKHISNIELYLNDYLCYYDFQTMEDGVLEAGIFLSGWYVEKCMWVSRTSLKEMAASLKKFYLCMSEKGYVRKEEYESMCDGLKDSMEEAIHMLELEEDYYW